MQLLSTQIESFQASSSWIRRMFEAGMELKKRHGVENICDFSLGNPDLSPPAAVIDAFPQLASQVSRPAGLGYMPNGGYPEARSALASYLSTEQQVSLLPEHVLLTCGAAGAINVFFRAVITPGEEILCPAPYFVEYGFYASNFGGVLCPVPSHPDGFHLDLAAFERAITAKTRAVIINSPNNPSGVIYSEEELRALVDILERATARHGRPIFLLSDEPYRFLAFDDAVVPAVLPLYQYAVVLGSFSKNLALAGERIGYIAVQPEMPGVETLLSGLTLTNRILGFVNAPSLGQRLMMSALGSTAEVSIYASRRQQMARVLQEAGIEYSLPDGTFYFFPKVPGTISDVEFVQLLAEERILAVPGSGFGYPGYFRLALCVDERFIIQSQAGFTRAAAKARQSAT